MSEIKKAREFYTLFGLCQNLPGIQSVRSKLLRAINSGKAGDLNEALRYARGYEKMARAYQKVVGTAISDKKESEKLTREHQQMVKDLVNEVLG